MTQLRLLSPLLAASFALAACQHQESAPPPMQPPPTVTSSPVPPPEAPHPAHPPPAAHETVTSIYKLDFVLTPRDAAPTSFSISTAEGQEAEVNIGKNTPMQVAPPPPPTGDKNAPTTAHLAGGVPRTDVGFKVKAHVRPVASGDDLVVFVDVELSAMDPTPNAGGVFSIRKLTAHGAALAPPGKSAPVVSVDDDKRHYDLTVTATKLR